MSSIRFSAPARPSSRPRPLAALLPVEFDPIYVDVIVRRYEAAAGDLAVLVETGETFPSLSARRVVEQAAV